MNADPYALPGDGVPIMDAKLTLRTQQRIWHLGRLGRLLARPLDEAQTDRVLTLYDKYALVHTARLWRGETRDNGANPQNLTYRQAVKEAENYIMDTLHAMGGVATNRELMEACNMAANPFYARSRHLRVVGRIRVEKHSRIAIYHEVTG